MPSSRLVGLGIVALGASIAALLPVFLVLYPAAGVGQADATNPAVVLPVVARNPALVIGPGMVEMVGHAVGAAAILGFWLRSGGRSFVLACATLAGILWTSVDMIDNAITLQLVPRLAGQFAGGDAAAGAAYLSASALIDAVRLGGHFGGGLWIIGISIVAVRSSGSRAILGWAGIGVGAVLALNPFVPALLNVSFLTLPLWLILFGVVVARASAAAEPAFAPQLAAS
jgi:hypothetical protein